MQTAYFPLIFSFVEHSASVWDPYQKYNSDKVERGQRQAAWFVKSRHTRYSSVSDMFDELGWPPLSQRRQKTRLILFYKIVNGLAQLPFEGVLFEAYKGTRRKHNMKFRQIGHTTMLIQLHLIGSQAITGVTTIYNLHHPGCLLNPGRQGRSSTLPRKISS